MEKDLYKILHVNPRAEPADIKAAYRRLVQRYHPDKNSSLYAAERMKEVNSAFDILSDPKKREIYDRTLIEHHNPFDDQQFGSVYTATNREDHTPNGSPSTEPRENVLDDFAVCDSCGKFAPVFYTSFEQNVGALVMRFSRKVEGNFCRDCIGRYFWSMTGITLLLGWWGLISFFKTLIIIPTNIVNYIEAVIQHHK